MGLLLNNEAVFGKKVLSQFMSEGWGSLSKRDLELLIFVLLEQDGALSRNNSSYSTARELRVTESKVAALRRDAYARWRPLIGEQPEALLKRVFMDALKENRLEQSCKFAERKMRDGFIPLLVEHPDDRAEIEHAIKDAGGIPVYERNREVVLIHYKTLLIILEKLNLLETNLANLQKELKKLLGEQQSLKDFLATPIKEIDWISTRSALNDAGGIIVEGGLRYLLPTFLKVIIPSIH